MFILTLMLYCTSKSCKIQVAKEWRLNDNFRRQGEKVSCIHLATALVTISSPVLLFFFFTGIEYDDDLNDEISVQQILRDMLDKEVVERDILNDLGFDSSKKRKDPRPKMELRHKQVSMIICRLSIITV